ncbi:hypothetical protein OAR37_02030 [Flavobacteriaceae bacterium]|nr:hypothetical protein [Flavobacteriaceae bacterium]
MSYTETMLEYVYDQYCLCYNMEDTLDFIEDEIDFTREEKQEKLNFDSYSHYIPSEEDGLFVYEDIYVDNFITFLSLNKKTSLDWYNSKNEKVDYEGGSEEFWVFHLT